MLAVHLGGELAAGWVPVERGGAQRGGGFELLDALSAAHAHAGEPLAARARCLVGKVALMEAFLAAERVVGRLARRRVAAGAGAAPSLRRTLCAWLGDDSK